MEIYYKELTHAVMETEKILPDQQGNSRARTANGLVPVQVQIQRQEKTSVTAQRQSGRESERILLIQPSILVRMLIDW